jgi:hypothetical protein
VRLSTPDVGYGTGSLMLQAGNHCGDVAGMLVRVAGMSLMINAIGGFVVGSTNELYVRADGSNNLYFGAVSIGLVQDWTTPGLASGYTANGNANGTQQFRVIDWLGTRFVQWRGGIGVTYSSGTIVNGGAPFSPALPSVARPSARRTVPVACSLTTYKAPVKMDFNADGTVSIIGTTTTEKPAWISLNDVMYSLRLRSIGGRGLRSFVGDRAPLALGASPARVASIPGEQRIDSCESAGAMAQSLEYRTGLNSSQETSPPG